MTKLEQTLKSEIFQVYKESYSQFFVTDTDS